MSETPRARRSLKVDEGDVSLVLREGREFELKRDDVRDDQGSLSSSPTFPGCTDSSSLPVFHSEVANLIFLHGYNPAIILKEGTKAVEHSCFSRFLTILNVLPQVVQLNGFSPV